MLVVWGPQIKILQGATYGYRDSESSPQDHSKLFWLEKGRKDGDSNGRFHV